MFSIDWFTILRDRILTTFPPPPKKNSYRIVTDNCVIVLNTTNPRGVIMCLQFMILGSINSSLSYLHSLHGANTSESIQTCINKPNSGK